MAKSSQLAERIEATFRRQVARDRNVSNAYLLIHSDTHDLHVNLAAGSTGDSTATNTQASYMASCGKLFTSTLIALLVEQGTLKFDDPIAKYLDDELIESLHIHKGTDYSQNILVRHLLNQSSGLPDNFWPLFKDLLANPSDFTITTRDAVLWTKQNGKPKFPPGTMRASYTDTNYHLLGLIVENILHMPFHEAMHSHLFDPLGMHRSSMLHQSTPAKESTEPIARFTYKGNVVLNDITGFAGLDYAGGSVVAPMEDLLIFMQSLVGGKVVKPATLQTMLNDKVRLGPNFNYGYGIWQLTTVPLLLPAKYNSWGVLGATGAFMFYHPNLDTYLIGTFNDSTYMRKCVRFMLKIMNHIHKSESRQIHTH
jgi:D-alanyl-D-alanine carboxypeptidase